MQQFDVLIHEKAVAKAQAYFAANREGSIDPGHRMASLMTDCPPEDAHDLLNLLFQSKLPQVFAESAVWGDGSDWNQAELSILGDMLVATRVTVFDDGSHVSPSIHEDPFEASLVFVPGVLLRNDTAGMPVDWDIVESSGTIDESAFLDRYRHKLVPAFAWIQNEAVRRRREAIITVPGLGAGQFAGRFRGSIGVLLVRVLRRLLNSLTPKLDAIRLVYFDPYDECVNEDFDFDGLRLRVRPYMKGNNRAQLCPIGDYEEDGDDFSGADLYSLVAWDHVSWPGNDYYAGSRVTDDGVKAAATDVMYKVTGVRGRYDRPSAGYLPPSGYATWASVVVSEGVSLGIPRDRLHIVSEGDGWERLRTPSIS